MNILETIISTPLGYIMRFFYMITSSFPLALFLFTLVTRIAMFPLNLKSQKNMARNAQMQPRINEVREKYKNNREKQTQEIQKIYAEEGSSPLKGCLPSLIQLPIFFGLMSVIYKPLTYILGVPADLISQAVGKLAEGVAGSYPEIAVVGNLDSIANQVPDLLNYNVQNLDFKLFGLIDLSQTPNMSSLSWLWLIPIASAVFQILSSYLTNYFNKKNGLPAPGGMIMTFILPLVFSFIAFSVPAGVGFYWACGSLIAVLQTLVTSTLFSPGQITARNEYKLAKARLENEQKKKSQRSFD